MVRVVAQQAAQRRRHHRRDAPFLDQGGEAAFDELLGDDLVVRQASAGIFAGEQDHERDAKGVEVVLVIAHAAAAAIRHAAMDRFVDHRLVKGGRRADALAEDRRLPAVVGVKDIVGANRPVREHPLLQARQSRQKGPDDRADNIVLAHRLSRHPSYRDQPLAARLFENDDRAFRPQRRPVRNAPGQRRDEGEAFAAGEARDDVEPRRHLAAADKREKRGAFRPHLCDCEGLATGAVELRQPPAGHDAKAAVDDHAAIPWAAAIPQADHACDALPMAVLVARLGRSNWSPPGDTGALKRKSTKRGLTTPYPEVVAARRRKQTRQSAKGSRTRIVSSRSGLVESRATGASISSSSRRMYLTAVAGSSAQERAPWVLSCQPSSVS